MIESDERRGDNTISVVISTYNRAALLARAVQSVLAQRRAADEIIVIDDGSTDATGAVVRDLASSAVRYFRQENQGLSAARNAGAHVATCEWLVFLDDDDMAEPDWLRELTAAMTHDVAVVCCGAQYVTPRGVLVGERLPAPLGSAFDHERGLFLAGTFAVRRSLFNEVGGYASGLTCSHQTELALRLLPACRARGDRVAVVDHPLVRIEERAAEDRPMSSPAALFDGATYVIERHSSRLRSDARYYADFCSIAGVSAARLGRPRSAVLWLARAARADLNAKRVARLIVAFVPPMSRRVWRSRDFRDVEGGTIRANDAPAA